jgi:hypothetical protein
MDVSVLQRAMSERTKTLRRTVKSCGPGIPTLMPSLRWRSRVAQVTVAKKPGAPGRSRISRKTIARGRPDDLAEPVVTAACFFSAGGPWVRPAPGLSRALSLFEGDALQSSGAICAARMLACAQAV